MILTIEEIKAAVTPIAARYNLKAVYLFGSYARGTANQDSDIDLLIDTSGTEIKSLLSLASVYCELEVALGKPVDLITVSSLEQNAIMPGDLRFRVKVNAERMEIYAAA